MASGIRFSPSRITVVGVLIAVLWLMIVGKLFYIQVFKHEYYLARAQEGHLGYSEIKPRRGEILIRDLHSGEVFRLATNTAFDVMYADPFLIENPQFITEKIAPLIFDEAGARKTEEKRITEARLLLPAEPTEEELARVRPRTGEDLFQEFKAEMLEKISQKTRSEILLVQKPSEAELAVLAAHPIGGVEGTVNWIKAYPPKIGDPDFTARTLSPIVDIPYERLAELLKGRNRYVVLNSKLNPAISNQIKKMMDVEDEAIKKLWKGIGFKEETMRFYPEGPLAAQVVGFVSQDRGAYGIEARFDSQLRGEKGVFKTQLDATGRQVTVGSDVVIEPSRNGSDITLTIDRSIQLAIERMLTRRVEGARADSGLVIVMEPKTGRVLAMAQYPAFDPNNYGEALDKEIFLLSKEEQENLLETRIDASGDETDFLVLDRDSNYRIQVFKKVLENGRLVFEKFKNLVGAGAYLNKSVSEIYEPGSIFKVIAMSIAIDAGEVTPNTTFNDTGPIKVDEFEIHNALDEYHGITDMKTVLAQSLNTGMAFVARQMGRDLFYRYIKKYGFGERTDIEFESESSGQVQEGSHWAESELVTYAFGQGIAVTPIQMITSVAAIANKGLLMQPYIVEKEESPDGKVSATEPRVIRRVISEETAATISAMMVNAIENGVAENAEVKDHYLAGKTGTAQTYKHGKPLTGPGTTITSFIGFGPIEDPQFVILTRIDRPRTSIWASSGAAPLFGEVADFLFRYYNIPPDKK